MRVAFALIATVALAGCAAQPARLASAPAPAAQRAPQPPATMQWLYGSGEATALSIQAFHAMRDYVLAAAKSRPRDSVVLAPGATLASPSFVPCGDRPLAAVFDVDETVLLNLGFEYDDASHPDRAYDEKRFARWEVSGADKVAPVPGAVTALRAMREAGVAVIFNTNRTAENAAGTEAAINGIGLGPAKHGDNLYLRGDLGSGSGKDSRRADIARRYCVIAMGGDQFGDFTDLLNERALGVTDRRRAGGTGAIANLWGNGWFLLPNPVYGPGVRGSFDEVFPRDKRWSDPQAGGN
jgi:5'-nucleotidase (lipoprotein e(P4) family)